MEEQKRILTKMANDLYLSHEKYFSGKLEGEKYSKKANEIRSEILLKYGTIGIEQFNDIYDDLVKEGDLKKFSGR